MSLDFKTNFHDQPKLRTELIRFINQIHSLDLTLWDKLGYWDRNYRPFSFFDGERMVANACLYSMNMRVNGEDCLVAQISGVGTDSEYRNKGLAYELDKKAMEWALENNDTNKPHRFFYLFADSEAFRLYEKCGFQRVTEHFSQIQIEGHQPSGSIKKLDVANNKDRDLVYQLACNRTPVSNLLGVNNPKLFMFWCLYFPNASLHYIEELDLLVMIDRKDSTLTVVDIVGGEMPEFSEIYPFIAEPTDRTVKFMFMPDRLNVGEVESVPFGSDRGTHLCGEFELESDPFTIPMTAMA